MNLRELQKKKNLRHSEMNMAQISQEYFIYLLWKNKIASIFEAGSSSSSHYWLIYFPESTAARNQKSMVLFVCFPSKICDFLIMEYLMKFILEFLKVCFLFFSSQAYDFHNLFLCICSCFYEQYIHLSV